VNIAFNTDGFMNVLKDMRESTRVRLRWFDPVSYQYPPNVLFKHMPVIVGLRTWSPPCGRRHFLQSDDQVLSVIPRKRRKPSRPSLEPAQ
jgi:hypothetical protein